MTTYKKQIEKTVLLLAPLGFLLGVGVAVLMLVSCGIQAKAKKQAVEQFEVPEFSPHGTGFYLNSADQQKTFNGSLLVWNQQATTEQVAGVMNVTAASTGAQVGMLKYIYEDVAPLAQELEIALAKRVAAENAMHQDAAGPSIQAADAMFEQMLVEANAQRVLSDEDVAHARVVFGYYCEAKLWERAVHNQLIDVRYTRRPLPAAMCESVYRQLALIPETEAACAPKAEGANYFECLWQHGVLKSRLLTIVYDSDATILAKVQKLSPALLRNKKNFGVVDNSQSRNFLKLNQVSIKDEQGVVVDAIPAVTTRQTRDAIIGSRSVFDFINDVEAGRLTFLPVSTEADDADPIQQRQSEFRIRLAKFNKLAERLWANEVLVNAPFARELKDGYRQLNPALSAELKTLLPDVVNVAADPKLVAAYTQTKAELQQVIDAGKPRLTTLTAVEQCEDDKSELLVCKRQRAALAQMAYVRNPEIARALLNVEVTLPRADVDIVHLRLRLSEDPSKTPIEACFNVAINQQVQCASGMDLIDEFSIDSLTGRISLVAKISDADKFGLGKREQTTDPFFNLIDADLNSSFLKIELAPNNLFGLVDILSGNATLAHDRDFQDIVAAGSLNLTDARPPVQMAYEHYLTRITQWDGK